MKRAITLLGIIIGSACAPRESPVDCGADGTNSQTGASGNCECVAGHHWLDESSSYDFRCVPDSAGKPASTAQDVTDTDTDATDTDPTCPETADCDDRECGADPVCGTSCGTSCGTCAAPPAQACKDAVTLVRYSATGQCVQGDCKYTPSNVHCDAGCDVATNACAGCTNECPTAGRVECDNGVARTCATGSNGCLQWSAPTACADNFCASPTSCGTCSDTCAQAGLVQCSSGGVTSCVADENGCLAWTAATPCPDGWCQNTTSCGTCDHECSTANATSCSAATLYTCRADAHGCRSWSWTASCSSGFCGDATACGSCNHQCSAGQASCVGGALTTCVTDSNGCRSFGAPTTCASGFCASTSACGQCSHTCATVGTTECFSGQVRTCQANANGCRSWSAYSPCAGGFCSTAHSCGACANACTTLGTSCSGGELASCYEATNACHAESRHSCEEGCDGNTCRACASFSDAAVGHAVLPAQATAMIAVGATLYIVTGDGWSGTPDALVTVDVSNPAAPVERHRLSLPKLANAIARQGNNLYLTGGFGLLAVSINSPFGPAIVSTPATGDNVLRSAAVVADGRLYYSKGSTLVVASLQTPNQPTEIGSIALSETADDIAASGNHVYVGVYEGLRVYNVSTPSTPTLVGGIDATAQFAAIEIQGNILFAAGGYTSSWGTSPGYSLRAYSLSTPSAPALVPNSQRALSGNTYLTPYADHLMTHTADSMRLFASQASGSLTLLGQSGAEACVAAEAGSNLAVACYGLTIIDPNRLAENENVTYSMVANANAITIDGVIAYVGGHDAIIQSVDLSAPLSPTVLGTLDLAGYGIRDLATNDGALVVVRDQALLAVDVSNPAAPTMLDSHDVVYPNYFRDLVVRDGLAYVAALDSNSWSSGNKGLLIFDISDPSNIVVRGSTLNSKDRSLVAVVGDYAYVAGDEMIDAVLVTNPASPISASTWDHLADVTALASMGKYLLVGADDGNVTVYDTSSPTAPTRVAEIDAVLGQNHGIVIIKVLGNRALISDRVTFKVVDLATPSSPARLLVHESVIGSKDAAWFGTYLVGVGDGALEVARMCL